MQYEHNNCIPKNMQIIVPIVEETYVYIMTSHAYIMSDAHKVFYKTP